MKILFIILFVGFLTSCSDTTSKVDKSLVDVDCFTNYTDFSPAFMPSCSISITKNGEIGQINVTVYNYRDRSRELRIDYADSAALTVSDFKYFFNTLDTVSLLTMKSDSLIGIGIDGVRVDNQYYLDSMKNIFSFRSPKKGSKEHKVVEAVLGLSRQKFASKKYQEYFESLEQYFSFGLPCKKISDSPYEIRIYGSLTSNEELELDSFINSLPSDRPILIDMTNFESMGTMYYPLFKSLITRNKKIIWATKDKRQLKEIGVDETKIAVDIETARQWIK